DGAGARGRREVPRGGGLPRRARRTDRLARGRSGPRRRAGERRAEGDAARGGAAPLAHAGLAGRHAPASRPHGRRAAALPAGAVALADGAADRGPAPAGARRGRGDGRGARAQVGALPGRGRCAVQGLGERLADLSPRRERDPVRLRRRRQEGRQRGARRVPRRGLRAQGVGHAERPLQPRRQPGARERGPGAEGGAVAVRWPLLLLPVPAVAWGDPPRIKKGGAGQLLERAEMKNGKLDGAYVKYHANCQVAARGSYVAGEKDGKWTTWTEVGIKTSE